VTSVALFVLSPSPQSDDNRRASTMSFGCAPMLATTGATCAVRF
jgi:hypothetical protein